MATRMQQRRGTAAQWISTNDGDGPILEVGEIGFETDTGKFKIGDGTNRWIDLDYFLDESEIDNITGDYVLSSTVGQANGVATLDGSGKLTSSQIPNIDELSQEAVNNALMAGNGLDKTYDDLNNTITLDIDSTVATKTYADDAVSTHSLGTTSVHGITDTAELATKTFAAELLTNATKTNITITGDKNGLTITAENGVADSTTDNLTEGLTNKYFTDERAQDAVGNAIGTGLSYDDASGAISVNTTTIQARVSDVSDVEIGYLNGVTSSIQDQLDDKAPLAGPTLTGTTTVDDLEIGGSLTFTGTATEISSTTTVIEDPLIYLADGNPGNINDLGFVANYNDGTYAHTGLVKDASAGAWKLFKGVTDEPTNTVNFSQGSLDDLQVGGLTASSITVGDISNTEFSYLNGVTSAIQTQLDGKEATLPSQSGNSGKYLTTDGTDVSWASLVVPISTGTATINGNSATTIDTTALSAFTSIEYTVSLKQGSKVRTSKVIVQNNGSSVDYTQFAITETGGSMSGVTISSVLSSTDALLQVTVTDAASTSVDVKFSKVAL